MSSVHVPRNVLVTGGCGFIGSNFMNYIHDAWPSVNFVNLDKLILNSDALYVKVSLKPGSDMFQESVRTSPRYQLVLADIRNREVVLRILNEKKIDTVIHFAADCTSTRCYGETIEAWENNLISFIEFLEAVREYRKVERFVHISTDEVYGDSAHGEDEKGKLETAMLKPGNPYAATKAAAEAYVHAYRAEYGLPLVILRINNIYGPNQWDVKVVPRFIDVARKQQKFTIQGTGQQIRSWLFVDDAAAGMQAVAERGVIGETYNLGTDFEMNVANLAHAVQAEVDKQLGREPRTVEFVSIPDRPYNDQRYLIDISKIQKELGWKPVVPFSEVVAHTLIPNKPSQKMSVIIFGGRGFVGQELQKVLIARKVPFQLAETKVGKNTDEEVCNLRILNYGSQVITELNRLCGTHVVCCTGRTHGGGIATIEYLEGGPDRVYENIRDNLYSATALAQICRLLGLHYTYVGTGYMFAYDKDHTIGGQGFLETDEPTFFGSSYSVVKGFTDRQQAQFHEPGHEAINARITLPLTFDVKQPRNLLSKIITYKQLFDVPVSISILPDCFDSLVTLMEKRYGGALNLVNPGPISLGDIVQIYKEEIDPTLEFERIGAETEKGRQLLTTKGNCALDTALLRRLDPKIPDTKDSLRNNLRNLAQA